MATFIAIPEKTQNKTSMKKVLDYVMQSKKTSYLNPETGNQYKLVSGQNCTPETAFKEFMNTKEHYRKTNGVFFKQYVQSFKPDCGATPDQIHQIGVELASRFEGFEVITATHIDADHWHNHFVVNSVNCETGLKIQINEKGLELLREQSDQICRQFGLEVLQPYQKPKQRAMNQREYRTALRGDSWKLKLLSAIDKAMNASASKAQFIRNMESLGYGVKWIDHYKYITYTTPDGQKCRDNRLFDEKYLKANMEVYFAGFEKTYGNQRGDQGYPDRAVSTGIDWSKARAMECLDTAHNDGRNGGSREHSVNITATDAKGDRPSDTTGNQAAQYRDGNGIELSDKPVDGHNQYQAERSRALHPDDSSKTELGYDGENENAGFVPNQVKSQMGADWGDIALNALALAASIEAMVENPKQKKKKDVSELNRKRQKKQHEREWQMER